MKKIWFISAQISLALRLGAGSIRNMFVAPSQDFSGEERDAMFCDNVVPACRFPIG